MINREQPITKVEIIENTILLMIHLCLLFVFVYTKVWLMVYVNIVSVSVYLACYYVILKRMHMSYMWIAYGEIVTHMIFAVLCLGWEYGFQLYCFPMIPGCFYIMYVKGIKENCQKHAILLSSMLCIVFVLLKVYSYDYQPFYHINYVGVEKRFYLSNCTMIFVLLVRCIINHSLVVGKSESELKIKADYDSLTGIYNRQRMQYLIEEMYRKAATEKKERFTVAILDVDDFKHINDTLGHDGGDVILKDISKLLTEFTMYNIYPTIVGRWGGEEFVILQVTGENEEFSCDNLENLRQKIMKQKFMYGKKEVGVTVTIGTSGFDKDSSIKEMLCHADEHLYIGKRQGKNMVVCDE